ncbi:MAG: ATP-binding protein [bacterium]|nr:ATP-binding protein [bacterium]
MDVYTSVVAPGKYENPFIYNAPVRGTDFYNREEIISELLHETVTGKSQGNVWVTGERQVGKTSLLRYIQSKYEHYDTKIKLYETGEAFNVAFIFLNVQDTKSRDDFYNKLRQSLKDFFDFKIETTDNAYMDFINVLKHLYFEKKIYIVFLIDEFDAFIEHLAVDGPKPATSFLAEWNKLIQGVFEIKNEPKVFSCIFAANHTIEELIKENDIDRRGSGLVLESMVLEWFTKKQIKELAEHYLKKNPVKFSDTDIDFCFKVTQGYPYFVQKLFSILYKQKSQDPDSTSYLAKVKKDYGNMFRETVKGWGGANMPKRTLEKLKELSVPVIKTIGDKSLTMFVDVLKTQI